MKPANLRLNFSGPWCGRLGFGTTCATPAWFFHAGPHVMKKHALRQISDATETGPLGQEKQARPPGPQTQGRGCS
eukprot:14752946-Alexandrium_andersonii.AAC.1